MAEVEANPMNTLRGDHRDGLEKALDQCGDRLYRLALRLTGVEREAEAALEDALRMAAADDGPDPADSAFVSWLYLSVARLAHQRRRQRCHHVAELELDDVVPPLSSDGGHFEPMADWSDRIGVRPEVLLTSIDALPPDYRTALILNDVEGASESDIAETISVAASAVKSHVHRARLFVRKRVSEYFASDDVA